MEIYHHVWLTAHPHRTEQWLAEKLAEGFDIHHLDGDHSNNDPLNLVLIDGGDHMMLHNGSKRMHRVVGLNRGGGRPRKPRPPKAEKPPKAPRVRREKPAPGPRAKRSRSGFTLHDLMRARKG